MLEIFVGIVTMHDGSAIHQEETRRLPSHSGGRIICAMRRLFLVSALFLCLLAAPAQADDRAPLRPDASAEDVQAVLSENVPLIAKEVSNNAGKTTAATQAATQTEMGHVTDLLKGVKPKILLDVTSSFANAFPYGDAASGTGFKVQILQAAISANATEADIPDLLASDVTYMDQYFGPGEVLKHLSWCNSPIATTSLTDLLGKIQADPSIAPRRIGQNGLLEVACRNRDPALQSLLKNTLLSACNFADTPPAFLLNAFDAAKNNTNPSIHSMVTDILIAMANNRHFTKDSYASRYILERDLRFNEIILNGAAPLTDPNFVASALASLSAKTETYTTTSRFETFLALALVGDSNAFATMIRTYFGLPDSNESGTNNSPSTQLRVSPHLIQEIGQSLLPAVNYHGPGDKLQALKNHYADAVYQNGQWSLTVSGSESSQPTAVPSLETTSSGESPSTQGQTNVSGIIPPADDLTVLPPDTSEDDVMTVVNNEAERLNTNYSNGVAQKGYDADVSKARKRLKSIPVKELLDLCKKIDYNKDYRKADILFGALDRNSTQADAVDLITSEFGVAYNTLNNNRSWCTGPAADAAITDELKKLQTELSTFNRRPSVSALGIASFNNTPAIQVLLQETIEKAVAEPSTTPALLLAALSTASNSENPAIHGQLPKILAALAKFHNRETESIAQPLGNSVSIVVERNPSFLRNPDFIANATACLKVNPEMASLYFLVPIALLGDSRAFGDTLETYYASHKVPTTSNQDPSTPQNANLMRGWKRISEEAEKWLISSIIYHGSGNKQQDIQDHYRDAVYQNGQWVLTMPDYVPPTSTPVADPSPATPAAPTVTAAKDSSSSIIAPEASVPSSPSPATSSGSASDALKTPPPSVTVISRAPIETLDSTGNVTGVSMAVVGTSYAVVRVDRDRIFLKDSNGHQYRMEVTATDYSTQAK